MTVFSLLLKYGLLNDRESALRLITPDFRKTCSRDFEWSYWVASRLSLAGAKSEALDWLEHAVDRGFINYPFWMRSVSQQYSGRGALQEDHGAREIRVGAF